MLRSFKTAWIESLGDLARYRMAVAGLNAALNAKNREGFIRNKTRGQNGSASNAAAPKQKRIDDSDDEGDDAASDAKYRRARERNEIAADRASIGSDALGDWELEEKETWRITARDWYAQALTEVPGTGRLHHHLGVLSRSEELLALHHFCRR